MKEFYNISNPREDFVLLRDNIRQYNLNNAIELNDDSTKWTIKSKKINLLCVKSAWLYALFLSIILTLIEPNLSLYIFLISFLKGLLVPYIGNLFLFYVTFFIPTYFKSKTNLYKNRLENVSLNDIISNETIYKDITTNHRSILYNNKGDLLINLCKTINLENLDKEKIYLTLFQWHNKFDIASNCIMYCSSKNKIREINAISHTGVTYYNKVELRWEIVHFEGFERRLQVSEILKNKIYFNANIYVGEINIEKPISKDDQFMIFSCYTDFTYEKFGNTRSDSFIVWVRHGVIRSMRSFKFYITNDMRFFNRIYRIFLNFVFEKTAILVENLGIESQEKKFCSEWVVKKIIKHKLLEKYLSDDLIFLINKYLSIDHDINPDDLVNFVVKFLSNKKSFHETFKILV